MSSALLMMLLLAAPPPDADVSVEPARPRNSISLEVPGLFWNGVELVGERFVTPHVSLLVGLGGRFAGEGDFSAFTLSVGLGARFWLNRFQLFSDLGGPMVGFRLDTGWTHVSPHLRPGSIDRFGTAFSLRAGYRFVIARRVEITPEAGLALNLGFDPGPRLAVSPRPSAVLGLTVGYMF